MQAESTRMTITNPIDPKLGEATQFQPGQSGNPAGRPMRPSEEMFKKLLAMKVEEMPTEELRILARKYGKGTVLEAMGWAMVSAAMKESTKAFDSAIDRAEGKAPQTVAVGQSLELPKLDSADFMRTWAFILAEAAEKAQAGNTPATPPPEL